ncbi:hypothetical protein SNE40_004203 [Patella caerulea]|uniref:Laccase n=1 Tax=Patella caerulea TaxID=87958 RepID=A0AAN8KJY5_PATCE
MNAAELFVVSSFILASLFTLNTAQTYSSHPCKRECVKGEVPQVCVYNFTVESYRVLSKACHDCPFNVSDCAREECVAGDGNPRVVSTFNRQIPGPKIEVCDGDRVIVWVKNLMIDPAATSVHWHGQHQRNSAYMDGVGFITQCAIEYNQLFKYDFVVGPAGTHWYHSHVGLQLADGLIGAFIVRQPKSMDHNAALYDQDLSDHIVIFQDWLPVPSIVRFMDQMHDKFGPLDKVSALINGKARKFDVKHENNTAKTPVSEFEVTQGQRYRFRLIGGSSACAFQVSVDSHTLLVIANDGVPVKPLVVDALIISPGERYDVVLHANYTIGNYWMRAVGVWDCYDKATPYAIVRYTSAPKEDPVGDPTKDRDGILLNPLPHPQLKRTTYGYNHSQAIMPDMLRYSGISDTNYTDEVVDSQYFTATYYLNNDNSLFNDKVLYPVKKLSPEKLHLTPVMDNITFHIPPVPPLSQPEDVDESWFCNRSSLVDSDRCLEDLCTCTHRIKFKLGEVIEIIMINQGSMFTIADHPMHLHGYSFRILGIEKFDHAITLADVQQMDKEGKLKRNFINPPLRDTFILPGASYAVLRFVANNPGLWFFHCHIDGHVVQGKAMMIQIGDVKEFPPRPADLPRCGGYGFTQKPMSVNPEKCTSSSTAFTPFSLFIYLLLCQFTYISILSL